MGRNYLVCAKAEKDGNTYCFDVENQRWVIITERIVPFQQVPEEMHLLAYKAALNKEE